MAEINYTALLEQETSATAMVAGTKRIAARILVLRKFANIRNYEVGVDAFNRRRRERPEAGGRGDCFCCGRCRDVRPLVKHHVIQLQYGGVNKKTNLRVICVDCHALIHPWLSFPDGFDDAFFAPVLALLSEQAKQSAPAPRLVKKPEHPSDAKPPFNKWLLDQRFRDGHIGRLAWRLAWDRPEKLPKGSMSLMLWREQLQSLGFGHKYVNAVERAYGEWKSLTE